MFELLSSDKTMILKEIPRQVKDNVYFLYDHKPNVDNWKNGKQHVFWDDFGVWSSTVTRTEYYIKESNGNLRYLTKKNSNSKFGIRLRNKFDVLNPQPQESDLIILKRYYASLKRDNRYKKRISWFEQFPGCSPCLLEKAVAEYLGKFLAAINSLHRNAKFTEQEFIRTSPKTKQKVRSELEKNKSQGNLFRYPHIG